MMAATRFLVPVETTSDGQGLCYVDGLDWQRIEADASSKTSLRLLVQSSGLLVSVLCFRRIHGMTGLAEGTAATAWPSASIIQIQFWKAWW